MPEIQLFYLTHYSQNKNILGTQRSFNKLGLGQFLAALKKVDTDCTEALRYLAESDGYQEVVDLSESHAFSIALPKTILSKLAIKSVNQPAINFNEIP